MIGFKNLTLDRYCPAIKPTIFPDKTSQIYNLPAEVLGPGASEFSITWHFESEGEVMHLLQLHLLLAQYGKVVTLCIPFLPYSRQDKEVSNTTTFAQTALLSLLDLYFECGVTTFDIHNTIIPLVVEEVRSISAVKYIVKALIDSQAQLICYPDKGAKNRYGDIIDSVVADKVRDQQTGKILHHELLETKHSLEGRNVLIVDDICDGGATFISVAKMLKEKGAGEVNLYVSHGIFSKGVHVLNHAGIKNIYTTDSYIRPAGAFLGNVKVYNLEN